MVRHWIETDEEGDAFQRVGEFWAGMREDLDSGQFWADRIKEYRGDPPPLHEQRGG